VTEVQSPQLSRRLKARHVELMAIGGTIGVGLFLGSARAIQQAGPGLIIGYAFGGCIVFFLMRALGELLLYKPVAGSFMVYADEFIGPFAAFATGWSYWFMWIVTCIAELTAVGVYVRYWFPSCPQWIPVLIGLLALYSTNKLTVLVFGEMEFWFALIKVSMIVALIGGGVLITAFHLGSLGKVAGVSNLWEHGGVLPFGFMGVLLTLQIVMFAFQGIEMIGITAGEAENPAEVLPRATNGVIFRILFFYIGALAVIMILLPWNSLNPRISPFVTVFEKVGIPGAGSFVTLVVITAALSSCNSGIYSTGRMLRALSLAGHAPVAFSKLNAKHLPSAAISASALVMLIGVFLNAVVPDRAFVWVTSVALVGTLWTWAVIMLAHRNYRRLTVQGLAQAVSYRMPGAPITNWLVIGFIGFVAVLLSFDSATRVAVFVAPIWFAILSIIYFGRQYLRGTV
jgi:AAT family amino acid transporter